MINKAFGLFVLFLIPEISFSQEKNVHLFLHPKNHLSERVIRGFDVSEDERFLATAGDWSNAFVWDIQSGALLQQLEGDQVYPYSVRISDTGRWVAGSGMYGEAKIWDFHTGKIVHRLRHNIDPSKDIYTLDFSPDGSTLLTIAEGYLYFWDVETGALNKKLGNVAAERDAQFLPDGNLLFIPSFAAFIFDVRQNRVLREFPYYGAKISSDYKTVITIRPANFGLSEMKEWDAETGALIRTTPVNFGEEANLSPNGDFIIERNQKERNKIKVRGLKDTVQTMDLTLDNLPLDLGKPLNMRLSRNGHFLFFMQGDYAFLYDLRKLTSKIGDDKIHEVLLKSE